MIYIICHKTDYLEYILNGINETDVLIIYLNDECNVFQKLFRKVWPLEISFPVFFMGRKIRFILKNLTIQDSLLVIDYEDRNLISTLSKLIHSSVKKYLWIWNPLKGLPESRVKRNLGFIKTRGFEICTFNVNDAQKYQITLLNQFYRMYPEYPSEQIGNFDFYFLGYVKDRRDEINHISQRLLRFRTLINIVRNESERISYEKNLEFIRSTRCIIDLVQKDQHGISLRPLEALAFSKKLLTNNEKIIDCEFYDPKNIFILGKDNLEDLTDFIFSDFIPVNDCIKRKYDVNQWINNFKN